MWFLTCDGDHLNGKRIWLRPGTVHLFGRTHQQPPNAQYHAITHKSVSRQHFELTVETIEPGSSLQLHKKSKVTIKDLGSKLGTFVDSERFQNAEKVLQKNDHTVKLGNYEVLFHVKWQPKVFTFASLSRASKQAVDPLADKRAQLEPLDVKCITEYVTQYTTHVVSRKRNTAQVLQALVNGRYVVADGFVEAVAKVGQKNGDDQVSALEEDFDANWPSELDHQPPPGNEPNARPARDEIFLPNVARSELFEKFVFVFCTNAQYDSLLPVVTGGGGKALLKEVPPPEDRPDLASLIDYVKECAGKKGDARYKLSQQPRKGGVVVVRPSDAAKCGGAKFFQAVDLALDQRSVEQNEFLEAVLTVDGALMERPLEWEEGHEPEDGGEAMIAEQVNGRDHSVGQSSHTQEAAEKSQPAATPEEPQSSAPPQPSTTIRKPRRPITQSRFKGFDDFDPSQVSKYSAPPPESQNFEDDPSQVQPSQAMEVDSQQPLATQTNGAVSQVSRKRPAESQLPRVETNEDMLNDVTKGSAAFKKARIGVLSQQKAAESETRTTTIDEDDNAIDSTIKHLKAKKGKKIDVTKALQENLEAAARAREEEEEANRIDLEGMDLTHKQDLAEIVPMAIRKPPTHDPEETWNPEWNGRPNFKKFKKRRPGQAQEEGPGQQRRKVLVGIEVHRPRAFNDDDYFLQPRVGKESQQRGSQSTAATEKTNVDDDLVRRIQRSRIEDEVNEVEHALDSDDDVFPTRNRQRKSQGQTQSQTLRNSQAAVAGRKRPGDASMSAPAAKRQSRLAAPVRMAVDDSDDEDGGVKFRRRRG
ncbi:hypothetical protein MBLNU457_4743t1 [Dothideomycetes sp. NU457]